MANLGDKLTVGDREGVVVRAVGTAEGTEYTIVVPHEDGARPVSHPLPPAVEAVEADEADDEKPAAVTKPAAKAPAKATPAKGADSK